MILKANRYFYSSFVVKHIAFLNTSELKMFSHSFSSNDISNIDHNHTSTSRPVSTAGLDSTLLNATRMSKQLKQIKQLLSKTRAGIRRENPSLTTSRELVGFCEEFAQEFLRCLSVLEPFLEVTRDIFEVVHSILKEYESSSSVNGELISIVNI